MMNKNAASTAEQPIETNEEKKTAENNNNNNNQEDYYLNAVAFIADGSLLPRKSGRSERPMSSPPAVPFASPQGSEQLTRVVTVEVGRFWRRYLNDDGSSVIVDGAANANGTSPNGQNDGTTSTEEDATTTKVTMRGMIIPRGVTLIVGGGYHGKSTILQAISLGIYDNIPGDGRERVVTHEDAVSVRAEDGRYVDNVNVSAFISNLPRSSGGGEANNKDNTNTNKIIPLKDQPLCRRTMQFRTKDASGSTSQAANVIESLESGASALLVDEDVSAANFMARDGRMRAMIMDEPITPLLYRVNGLYLSREHQVSTVIVVGGVGEWLDVADAVVLMKDYVAYDGLAKARSVSYQFSYGHVQYGGRGVVHRLPWEVCEDDRKREEKEAEERKEEDKEGGESKMKLTLSPLRRRPESNCVANTFKEAAVHLLESGSSRLWFYRDDDDDDDNGSAHEEDDSNNEDDDNGILDMSKCSQLVGNASEQLYGCGICVLWLMQESQRCPEADLPELLDRMDQLLNCHGNGTNGGMNRLMASLKESQAAAETSLPNLLSSHSVLDLWETVGFAYRPRRHEVAMALTRMRGLKFDILPEKVVEAQVCPEEEAKRLEEESRKRALAELWANRRSSRR